MFGLLTGTLPYLLPPLGLSMKGRYEEICGEYVYEEYEGENAGGHMGCVGGPNGGEQGDAGGSGHTGEHAQGPWMRLQG